MKTEKNGGDAAWLRRVMDRHEGPLVRYAARILGDVDRGRDVAQETFLRLWRSDQVGRDDHLAEWLFTICRNRALDVRRKEPSTAPWGGISGTGRCRSPQAAR